MIPFGGGKKGDEFSDADWEVLYVVKQSAEVGEGVVDLLTESDPIFEYLDDGQLHLAEEVFSTRHGQCHGAELAKNLVPLLHSCAFLIVWDACEDCCQSFHSVLRQGDRHVDRVQDPPQDNLGGVP